MPPAVVEHMPEFAAWAVASVEPLAAAASPAEVENTSDSAALPEVCSAIVHKQRSEAELAWAVAPFPASVTAHILWSSEESDRKVAAADRELTEA